MALSNSGNTQLAERAIAQMAYSRLYDTFPMRLVSHATGPRGFTVPRTTAATTGSTETPNEGATISTTNFDPTFDVVAVNLTTFRAQVTISNELLADAMAWEFISNRLAGQLSETVAQNIISNIASELSTQSRYTSADHFDVGAVGITGAPKIEDHSGFKCLSELSNAYRQRAVWVFSPTGLQNWGTQEGRGNLVTLGIRQEDNRYGRLIGETMLGAGVTESALAGGGGGGGGKGGEGEGELSKKVDLITRASLEGRTPRTDQWHTAYLGCPVYTSSALDTTHNANDGIWAMLVDMSAYLCFTQPLSVKLDTESRIANNQSIVHAVFRATGAFLEPTAGWALLSPST